MNHVGAIGIIIISPYPSKFQNVKLASTSIGYGYSSMKGGVGVRLKYYPEGKYGTEYTEFSFASIHLNAFEGDRYYLQRNANMLNIIRSLDFGDGYGLIKPDNHIFIFGDLNYRTTKDYKPTSVVARNLLTLADQHTEVDKEYIHQLFVQYDELHKALKEGDVLLGFSEGRIDFQPSYKYHINTGIYNSKRCPSWCDRILFLSTYEDIGNDNLGLRLLRTNKKDGQNRKDSLPVIEEYNAINSLLTSDHRPVYARISVPFNPPKSIISPMSGCLEIVSTGLTSREGFSDYDQLDRIDVNNIIESGPTTIYLKPTKLDFLIHRLVTPTVDGVVGYGLWLGTTNEGRMALVILILFTLAWWYIW
ncbi:putative inositol polyphosphate-5-phosphatase Inp54p [Candida maltosa Xu316]|uniref:Putative inositol polyphosphate-5-phosphatase Inp54p n=1 Tax=Candida maltosa (strain Xu316) TaxID=1245528 RepID=M3IIW1_CANMX|nr:putative inositol polyphosphate-5-phosphatase Inp54p [Candida maltosa Xu316]